MLCEDLEGWNSGVGGRFTREGIHVYLWLIHIVVQQKPTQHCKVITLQLKINFLKRENTVCKCCCLIVKLCPILLQPCEMQPASLACPWIFPRILEWVAFPFFRGFPTQGSNPGLPHCRQILYQGSHQGSPCS